MTQKYFYNTETLKMPKYAFDYSESQTGSKKDWNYREAIKHIDLEAFPVIDDFAIEIFDTENLGKHIQYVSEKQGVLTTFPWWDNVESDIENWSIDDIPLGTHEHPFDDLDQGWQVLIFKDDTYVYILEGDEPGCEVFATWYKVNLENYIAEWQKVLDSKNTI